MTTQTAPTFTFSCDDCSLQGTEACEDCVVTFLLEREPEDAVVIDADEARAIRMLERAGLVPSLRFSDREAETRPDPVGPSGLGERAV